MSYAYTQRRRALGFCTPSLHFLTCHHPFPTPTPTACGPTCLFPQFSPSRKRTRPFRCPVCVQQLDEEYLLAQLAENDALWQQHAERGWGENTAEEREEMEDLIWEKEGLLHASVHRRVWRRFLVEGREGLEEVVRRRRRREEEEEEEEEMARLADAPHVEYDRPNVFEGDQRTVVPAAYAGNPFAISRLVRGPASHAPANHNTPVAGSPATGEGVRDLVSGNDGTNLTEEEIRGILEGNRGAGAPLEDYWDGEYSGEYEVEEHWEIESV